MSGVFGIFFRRGVPAKCSATSASRKSAGFADANPGARESIPRRADPGELSEQADFHGAEQRFGRPETQPDLHDVIRGRFRVHE